MYTTCCWSTQQGWKEFFFQSKSWSWGAQNTHICVINAWSKLRVICLSLLFVEDAEDMYIFGLMVTGVLGVNACLGAGSYLVYCKLEEVLEEIGKLKELLGGLVFAVGTQTYSHHVWWYVLCFVTQHGETSNTGRWKLNLFRYLICKDTSQGLKAEINCSVWNYDCFIKISDSLWWPWIGPAISKSPWEEYWQILFYPPSPIPQQTGCSLYLLNWVCKANLTR